MRLLELKLTEAGLEPGEFKGDKAWRRDFFVSKILAGKPFELVDGSTVMVDKSEAARIKSLFDADQVNAVGLVKTDKGNFLLSKFLKTMDFKKQPVPGQEEEDTTTDKISNRGDVSEGILSSALFAKLVARSRGEILDINVNDVWAVVDSLTAAGTDRYSVTVKDANKKVVNDTVVFTIILPKPAYLDFINKDKRDLLTSEVNSAVMFANSDDNRKFSEYFYLNGKPDTIEIICDGGNTAKQKVSKVDIEVVVTDQLTGKKDRKRLNISLKANAKQFGQVGAGDVRIEGDIFDKQLSLWGKFGVDVEPVRKKFDSTLKKVGLAQAIAVTYQYAAKTLNTLLAGNNDEDEYLFLKDLANGLNYYATLNTPGVLLVNFKAGGYEVISFDNMESKLQTVDLAARYRTDVSTPQVEVYDMNSGDQLFQVRLKLTEKERRNYVEKGSLMSKLLGTTVKPVKVKKK